jgi:small multidrug resistance family-3 protein
MAPLWTFLIYVGAGIAEIAGCYAFWAWLRLGHSPLWLVPGAASLALFAFLLTRIDAAFAGRAYAAYAGVYLVSSLGWLWLVEGKLPDRWDVVGGAVALAGAAIILFGPRSSPA